MYKLRYEETDKKIEIDIYGIVFEIKDLSKERIEELEKIEKNENNLNIAIDSILGENSANKINEQRKKDGYPEMNMQVQLGILGAIFETYIRATTKNVFDKMDNAVQEVNNKVNNINNINRDYRRNNYSRNRRNYRRY